LSLLPTLVAMQQRFLVLQNRAEIAHVKFPDRGSGWSQRVALCAPDDKLRAIRGSAAATCWFPDFAEPVIGRRFAPTRWLHPGFDPGL